MNFSFKQISPKQTCDAVSSDKLVTIEQFHLKVFGNIRCEKLQYVKKISYYKEYFSLQERTCVEMPECVCRHLKGRVFVGLANGTVAVFRRDTSKFLRLVVFKRPSHLVVFKGPSYLVVFKGPSHLVVFK